MAEKLVTKAEAEQIEAVLGEEGACRSYSGRGMFGERCFGVSTDSSEFKVALVLAEVLGHDRALAMADRTCHDAMGRAPGKILYWPGWTLEAETDSDEDEEEDDEDDPPYGSAAEVARQLEVEEE